MSTFIGIVVGVVLVAGGIYFLYRKFGPKVAAVEAEAAPAIAALKALTAQL